MHMKNMTLNNQHKSDLVAKIKTYFEQNLDYDIGQFDAEFLLDFFAKELGVYYYNQGVQDAGQLVNEKLEDLQHTLYEIEQPLPR